MKTSREDIVAAARDLMRDKGYAGASMKDLADRVGLLKGSLYSHFPSKESLIADILTLVRDDILKDFRTSGDWRDDYQRAMSRIADSLTANRRCVGLHLAYGLDDGDAAHEAVRSFFEALRSRLAEVLKQGLDGDLAEGFATETITMLEGATLWLALNADEAPMKAARNALLQRAEGHAGELEGDNARALLNDMIGDWRQASVAEKRLATLLVETEADLLTTRAALAGQIAADSRIQ